MLFGDQRRFAGIEVEIRRQRRQLIGNARKGQFFDASLVHGDELAHVVRLQQRGDHAEGPLLGAIAEEALAAAGNGGIAQFALASHPGRDYLKPVDGGAVGNGQMPLAHVHRLIAGLPQPLSDVGDAVADGQSVGRHAGLGRHPPGKHAAPRRRAQGVGRIGLQEARSPSHQGVHGGRLGMGAAQGRNRVEPLLVGHQQ